MKGIILTLDKIKNKILRIYRNYVFYCKTGYKVTLISNVTLINTNLKIGKNVTIYPNVMFFGDGLIEIGNNVDIGNNVIIYASKDGGVKIGNDTMIAANCYIIDMDHGPSDDELVRKQKNVVNSINIGDDVWISENCTILRGTIIENGGIVGAKSLVKSKIKKNSIVYGIPAKFIRYRKK